jgi:hypothetical protein
MKKTKRYRENVLRKSAFSSLPLHHRANFNSVEPPLCHTSDTNWGLFFVHFGGEHTPPFNIVQAPKFAQGGVA